MITASRATAGVVSWIGRTPPEAVECNKPSGICGYLDCAKEMRCLERSRTKPPAQSAASSPATFGDPQ